MYAIYAYIDPPNHPNVGKYTIHGVFGTCGMMQVLGTREESGPRRLQKSENHRTASENPPFVKHRTAWCQVQVDLQLLRRNDIACSVVELQPFSGASWHTTGCAVRMKPALIHRPGDGLTFRCSVVGEHGAKLGRRMMICVFAPSPKNVELDILDSDVVVFFYSSSCWVADLQDPF